MPITVICPSCSAKLNAPDTASGKRVKCPKPGCGEIIEVPEAPAFEVVDDEPDQLPPRKKSVKAEVEDDPKRRKKLRDESDDDEDEDEQPRRKRGRDEDDEEERPRRRRSTRDEDEDEDERPRRRRARDDDEDEEREPRPGRCPECNSSRFTKVSYTWWGGIIGPAILSMARCNKCSTQFNRKSGKRIEAFHIIMYTVILIVIGTIIGLGVAFANT